MTSEFRLSVFLSAVGDRFRVAGTDIDLELTEATGLTDPRGDGQPDDRFALVFRGPADMPLDQQTVPLRHAELGEMAIFVVPIGEDAEHREYEAIFSGSV